MASIRFRSNKWQARISRKGQQALVKTFHSKEDAQKWARSIEVEWDKGTFTNQSLAERTTFKELIERYMAEVTPTMRGAKPDLIRLAAISRRPIAKLNLVALTPQRICEYRDLRLQEVAPATVIRELAYFSSIINHARREWGINVSNPVLMVKKPNGPQGRSRILDGAELDKLLEQLKPVGRKSIWMAPLVQLALETAMRRGELLSLRWEHVDLVHRTAHIELTKNGEARTVPLSTKAVEMLLKLPRSIDGRVFPVTHEVVSQAFNRARKQAGIENIRFHDLRRTAITKLAERLPNLVELSAVSGHKSLAMLKRYYHPNPQQLALKLG